MLPTSLRESDRQGFPGCWLLQALVLLLSACSSLSNLTEQGWQQFPEHIELRNVPYYPEDRFQCGPQSLAMVLSYAGVNTLPADLIDAVYVPERKGSFAVELRAAARIRGRLPYKIEPSLPALTRALNAGYPVLIMQNLGLGFSPVWHFAVTIGFNRSRDIYILRSGPQLRVEMSAAKFERRWRLADYWAIILFSPDNFPEWIDQNQYENQLALMENIWTAQMETIYHRMHARWPDSTMALLGLGNIAYNTGSLDDAAAYYRSTLQVNQNHIAALHNLAQVRFELHDYAAAGDLICRAKRLAHEHHPLQTFINKLEQKLEQVTPEYACPAPG